MKNMSNFSILFIVFLFFASSYAAKADQWVTDHYRSNGSHVKGHMRSNKNIYRNDNYSTKGNVNPYTGKKGSKKRRSAEDYSNKRLKEIWGF